MTRDVEVPMGASDHLPECTLAPGACLAPGPHQEADGFCWKCHSHCICERLRACEARQYGKAWGDLQKTRHLDYQQGYAAALAEASAIIAELEMPRPNVPLTLSYLAGLQAAHRRIDALKGEANG